MCAAAFTACLGLATAGPACVPRMDGCNRLGMYCARRPRLRALLHEHAWLCTLHNHVPQHGCVRWHGRVRGSVSTCRLAVCQRLCPCTHASSGSAAGTAPTASVAGCANQWPAREGETGEAGGRLLPLAHASMAVDRGHPTSAPGRAWMRLYCCWFACITSCTSNITLQSPHKSCSFPTAPLNLFPLQLRAEVSL